MKEKCYYHYIIKDTIKPPLSQERWEVFSLFFKKSPPKEQAFVRLSHPDRGKGPAHRTPGRGRPWTPPFPGKRERAPALSLSSPWVLVRLSSSLGRLLKSTHPPFRPIAWPGKAAGPGSSPQTGPKGPTNLSAPTDSPGRARLAEFRRPQPAEKNPIIFSPGMYRGKYSSHPESAGFAGAVRGASPNFGRGLPPSRQLDTPVLCPPERRQIPGAPPKIPHSTLFSASTISKSRSFLRAVRFTAKEKTTVSTAAHR